MNEQPGYYAVIPASILFDKNICSDAKILYGEITALCNKEGYCWAGNAYFAELHGVSDRTVQRWLMSLKDAGYVNVEYKLISGTREIETRKIRIAYEAPFKPKPYSADRPQCPQTKRETGAATENAVTAASPPEASITPPVAGNTPEVVTNLSGGGDNSVRGVVTNLSGGGDKFVADNIININKATTASPPPDRENQGDTAVAAVPATLKTAGEIKADCLKIDKQLVFDRSFYPKAAFFMFKNNLDSRYPAWLYEYCEKKQPRTVTGLFYSLFFAENVLALFLAEQAPDPPASRPPPEPLLCPVCGRDFVPGEDECPVCHLRTADFADEDCLREARAFYALPPDQKTAYDSEIAALYSGGIDLKNVSAKLAEIRERYGIPG